MTWQESSIEWLWKIVLIVFILSTTQRLQRISTDVHALKQTAQFEEEPIDPFCISTIIKGTDTLQVLCAPEDTLRLNRSIEVGYDVYFEYVE